MIFDQHLIRAILTGRKTATRRPRQPHETECRYQPGRVYAIQPARTRTAVGRIRITTIEQTTLIDLTYQDARREGFATQRDFFDHWIQAHGTVDIHQPIWVIAFQLEQDSPRLLTPSARPHGTELGYTDQPREAMTDEPEAVDADTLQRFATEAQDRYSLIHAEQLAKRDARSLANQLREAHARATVRGVDVTPEIQAIRKQLDQMRAKLGIAA